MPRIRKYIDVRYNAWIDLIPDYKKIIDKVISLTYKHSYIAKITGNIKHKTLEIYIFLDDDKSLHEKNLMYRNKDKPTNVISVPVFKTCYKDHKLLENIMLNQLGDIYISLDTLIKEVKNSETTVSILCKSMHKDSISIPKYNLESDIEFPKIHLIILRMHFAHMVCHGFLHLLGYDHIDDDDAEVMENIEKAVLSYFL